MTEAAFHTVWMPLQGKFYRIAFYLLEDEADAKDAVQDLYLKLWGMREQLDLVQNPSAYGTLMMRNLCIDRIRRRKETEALSDDLPGKAPPDEELVWRESLGQVLGAMQELPPGQQQVVRLHLLQGLSYDEIARQTGLSPLNIRVQLSLARKKLRTCL